MKKMIALFCFINMLIMRSSLSCDSLFDNFSKFETTSFYIVRHGQTDWNVSKRVQGHSTISLNSEGKNEARVLLENFKDIPFSICYSSSLQRAIQTATLFSQELSLEIKIDPRLNEPSFGEWEGKPCSDFFASENSTKVIAENNQSIKTAITKFLEEATEAHQGNTILVVTHGGVIRNILHLIANLDCSVDDINVLNTGLLHLTFSNGKWVVEELRGITIP